MKRSSPRGNTAVPEADHSRLAFSGGSYSLLVTFLVLAILIAVNILVSALPSTWTKLDISSSQLYSVTSNTKAVVNNLDEDVTIYWIVQADAEDDVLDNLLAKYESLSDHITVSKKNPDVYPTFAEAYTDETVSNNSLVVECGSKYRYISYSDIYLTDIDYTTYSYVYSFDGEGAITSAIDYVVSDSLPQIYTLEGHGEAELPAEFSEQIEKSNMECSSFSLLNEDAIPEDADCVLIYGPSSDISTEEAELLSDYVENGGRLMVFAGPTEDGTLTNLYSVLEAYGVTVADGVVVEGDRNHYAFQSPYIMLPDLNSSDITDSLIDENYYVIMPLAGGMTVDSTSNGTVTELLTTSDDAFSKIAGYALTTYDKEDGDIDGPFALAVAVSDYSGGQIVWTASSDFLDESYNAYSSGANLDFAMNALSSLIGESEAMAIRTKSLGYNYLTISDTTASALKLLMIFSIPVLFLGIGIAVLVRRRRLRK